MRFVMISMLGLSMFNFVSLPAASAEEWWKCRVEWRSGGFTDGDGSTESEARAKLEQNVANDRVYNNGYNTVVSKKCFRIASSPGSRPNQPSRPPNIPPQQNPRPIGVSMQLAQTFGYIKNSRLVATGRSPESINGHMNWAINTGQSLDTLKNEIRSDLNQARSLIAQSPSMQSCEAFGYMKNGMLALLRGTTEPHKGHVNWCRIELERGNWGQVVSAMDQEFVQPIQATLR